MNDTLDPDPHVDPGVEVLAQTLRAGADTYAIHVWNGVPENDSGVEWPNSDAEAFLEVAHRVGARILYLEETRTDGTITALEAMFCIDGIQHWFPSQPLGGEDHFEAQFPMQVRVAGTPIRIGASVGGTGVMFGDADDDSEVVEDDEDLYTVYSNPYMSYAGSTPREVTGALRDLVDQVVAAPDFDSDYRTDSESLVAAIEELDPRDAADVRYVAPRVFDAAFGRKLDNDSKKIAVKVVTLPDYHPLLHDDDVSQVVATYLEQHEPDADPRVLRRVVQETSSISWDRGLRDQAEDQMRIQAIDLLDSLPAEVRDQVGFTHRTVAQRSLLEPYLDDVDERLRDQLVSAVRSAEDTKYSSKREARYATASRALAALGKNRSTISRALGVSTSVLNRIEAAHRRDIELADDDPILTLAPELRSAT